MEEARTILQILSHLEQNHGYLSLYGELTTTVARNTPIHHTHPRPIVKTREDRPTATADIKQLHSSLINSDLRMTSGMPSTMGKRCPAVGSSWYRTHESFSAMYRDNSTGTMRSSAPCHRCTLASPLGNGSSISSGLHLHLPNPTIISRCRLSCSPCCRDWYCITHVNELMRSSPSRSNKCVCV
jgi:hypothetical protein